jgi:hypothetical protein
MAHRVDSVAFEKNNIVTLSWPSAILSRRERGWDRRTFTMSTPTLPLSLLSIPSSLSSIPYPQILGCFPAQTRLGSP